MIHRHGRGKIMFGWGKKPPLEIQYAQNLSDGLVAHNEFGDITALSLKIPTALHQAYQNKILLQREMICFVALMQAAHPGTVLHSVMPVYGELVVRKAAERGLQLSRDQLASASLQDVESMFSEPYLWGQRWLAEFRNDPEETFMVALFAEHCLKLFSAYKTGIENTSPR
jgi:hypothetical protein